MLYLHGHGRSSGRPCRPGLYVDSVCSIIANPVYNNEVEEKAMGKHVEERTALVTGAIRGIGLAIARSFAARGIRTVITYYDWLDDLEEMHRTMKETGTPYHAVSADLRDKTHAENAVEEAIRQFGRLDILVNNIERGGWPVVHGAYTPEQWELEFNTTITAKWNLFNSALPYLRKGRMSSVINIGSIAGMTGRTGPAGLVFNDCYSLANRALGLLTRQWARMGAPEVRVNELILGFFETRHGPGTRGWGLLTSKQKEAILQHTPLKRTGSLKDITSAIDYLVFDASFMTGSRIVLDGGYILGCEGVPELPDGVVQPGESTFGGSRAPEC